MQDIIIGFLLIVIAILIYMVAYSFGYNDAYQDYEEELTMWKRKAKALETAPQKEKTKKEELDEFDQLIEILDYQQGAHKRAKGK